MYARICSFLFIFTLITTAQLMAQKNYNYDTAWKKVEQFMEKNLPKSASEQVEKIYTQAKKDGAQAQQVKALVYKSQLVQQVQENDWLKNVQSFEAETSAAKEPVRQILHSISADLYYNYYQNKRWQIYNRSKTTGFKKDDPETWGVDDFHKKIIAHYEASLQNEKLLQQTKLAAYDPIIYKGNQRALRPTLFDLLANKALDYYKTDEQNITKPAYKFELSDQASLSPFKIFIRYDYKSKDSTSRELAAIKLYQELLRFHADDKDKAALVDADIDRIEYAYQHSVTEGKRQLYKEALEHIYTQYPTVPEAMQAGYLLAQWWRAKGDEYKPGIGTEEDKNALKVAVQYAEEVAKKFPKSEGGVNAYNLLNELRRPAINLQVEKVNLKNQAFRSLVGYSNLNQISLRLIKVDDALDKQLTDNENYEENKYWKTLLRQKAIRSWNQKLPSIGDYRQHCTEIKVDALPNGKYILLTSKNADFALEKNPLAAAVLYVSNISFVNSGQEYFVLERETGKPLATAAVDVWENYYDYNSRSYKQNKKQSLKTDKNGFFKLPEDTDKNNRRNIRLDITHGGDRLFLADDIYNYRYYYNDGETTKPKTELDNARYFIFLDRGIYRPAQTVFFKAIGITQKPGEKQSSLFLPNVPITVELKDANGQVVDTLATKPNEFGSMSGSFKLLASGLTGQFTVGVKIPQNSQAYFNVEEYKRPKFLVEFEKLKGTYQLNDTIKITGTAKAYAGNNIDGATVSYRVKRNTRFLYPWLFWGRGKSIWPPSSNSDGMEITHGETTTDADGKFNIDFTAIPDLSTDKKLDPTFDYTVEADVTDINGETRSSTSTVSVGYKSLLVAVNIPGGEQQNVDSFKNIQISTTNLASEPVPSLVKIKIYSLKTPERLIRERYWEQPDTTVMSYTEYVKNFPHDEYRNESDHRSWEKGAIVQEDTLTTGTNSQLTTHNSLKAGWYMIEATTKDKNGNEVKAIQYVALSDVKNNQLPSPAYNVSQVIKGTVEPGEQASFLQGSSADDLFVIQEKVTTDDGRKTTDRKFDFVTVNRQLSTVNFEADEASRGGYTINRFFVKDNRVYTLNWPVNVPWTNKELKISFETFRDKLLPGAEEKWKVKISGYKGDAVAAEMLASMYDASLDQFKPHAWGGLNIWNSNYFGNNWAGQNNFSDVASTEKAWYEEGKSFDKMYDRLISIQANENRLYRSMARGRKMKAGSEGVYESIIAPGVSAGTGIAMAPAPAIEEIAEAKMSVSFTSNDGLFKSAYTKQGEIFIKGDIVTKNGQESPEVAVQIRKNFNETAFFFPDLHTNEKGEIEFSFIMPEALTQWKLQTLAHTKDLQTAMATKQVVTQKELMVQPNAPRFFRQGDSLSFVAKISNLSDKAISGTASLQMLNTATNEAVDGLFQNSVPSQPFTVAAGQSVAVRFPLAVPMNYNDAVSYRIIAKADGISDGEEMALPVLTNRMLVTESFPINLRGTNTKSFKWDKLLASGSSTSLQNQSLTVEYTSNPAWYAVQALPYLMEYPYDCAEQTWNRFYANALASKIANSTPKIKAIFEQWKNLDTAALMSNLEKNQELKAVLLEETPWVLQAKNEAEQKKNIALLFDMVRMSGEAEKAMGKLKDLQSANVGFVWFKGGPDDRYMTQYILTGIGHLQKLGAWPASQQDALQTIIAKALPYLDARLKDEYDNLIRYKTKLDQNNLSQTAVQYLYMRSFFPDATIAATATKAADYYTAQAKKYWPTQGKYNQGMIALALNRSLQEADGNSVAHAILKSLTENSITNEEFGMYWKEFNTGGYYWWQSPIESHSLLIEAYSEVESVSKKRDDHDEWAKKYRQSEQHVSDLKTWLLKQKQTQNWRTTKATADACYALLLQANYKLSNYAEPLRSNLLSNENSATITLGKTTISPDKTEAGTGYLKSVIDAKDIKPDMGNITVNITPAAGLKVPLQEDLGGSGSSWGSVYWQYFQDLDKITTAATPLQLSKKLFMVKNSDRGPVLTPLADNGELKVGDKVKVRIELRVDRNLEYVHLKDMRASCFEPVNVLSQYKYQDGLGYYEATKDASTNFFISYLNKGTYVFEYELNVTHTGNFSNGISSIQCMYAPEFTSHSEGIRVRVK